MFKFFKREWGLRHAFTLAETLIVITAIGVIAAIIILATKTDFSAIRTKRLKSQQLATLQNIKHSLGIMHSENRLKGLSGTDEFVDNLKTFIQTKEDSKDYSYIEKNSADALKKLNVELKNPKSVTLANGTVLYVDYIKEYSSTSKSIADESVCNKKGSCITTNETMNYVQGLFDVNGQGAPNEYGQDIFLISADPNPEAVAAFECDLTCSGDKTLNAKSCRCECKKECAAGFTQNDDCTCSCDLSCGPNHKKIEDVKKGICKCELKPESELPACSEFGKRDSATGDCVCDLNAVKNCKGAWDATNCICNCDGMEYNKATQAYDSLCNLKCNAGYAWDNEKFDCCNQAAMSTCKSTGGNWNNSNCNGFNSKKPAGGCTCNQENASYNGAEKGCTCITGFSGTYSGSRLNICCSDDKRDGCKSGAGAGSWNKNNCTCTCPTNRSVDADNTCKCTKAYTDSCVNDNSYDGVYEKCMKKEYENWYLRSYWRNNASYDVWVSQYGDYYAVICQRNAAPYNLRKYFVDTNTANCNCGYSCTNTTAKDSCKSSGYWSRTWNSTSCNCDQTCTRYCRCGVKPNCSGCYSCDPIVLDFSDKNDGVKFTGLDKNAVEFDLNGDGEVDKTTWLKASKDGTCKQALLVVDKNGNGIIDDGTELFGDQLEGNSLGFDALKKYDSNKDGVIDKNDDEWSKIQLWCDNNGDGKTDEGELVSLATMGVTSLDTNYADNVKRDGSVVVDKSGNLIPATSNFKRMVEVTRRELLKAQVTTKIWLKKLADGAKFWLIGEKDGIAVEKRVDEDGNVTWVQTDNIYLDSDKKGIITEVKNVAEKTIENIVDLVRDAVKIMTEKTSEMVDVFFQFFDKDEEDSK